MGPQTAFTIFCVPGSSGHLFLSAKKLPNPFREAQPEAHCSSLPSLEIISSSAWENKAPFPGDEWALDQVPKGGYAPLGTQQSDDWVCLLKHIHFQREHGILLRIPWNHGTLWVAREL